MKKYYIIPFLFLIFLSGVLSNAQDNTNNNSTDVIDTTDTNTTDDVFLADYYIGADTPPEPIPTESPILAFLRILFITAILGFLTWVVLRFFFRRNALSISTEGKSLEILATIPAGLGSYFVISKLHNLYYLCSLSQDGLRLLDKITDQEAIDFIELNKVQTLPQDVKFVDLLENMPDGAPKKALEFLREKINQLQKK